MGRPAWAPRTLEGLRPTQSKPHVNSPSSFDRVAIHRQVAQLHRLNQAHEFEAAVVQPHPEPRHTFGKTSLGTQLLQQNVVLLSQQLPRSS